MITPLLCGTDKAAVVDTSASSPSGGRKSSSISGTARLRSRPASAGGRGGRSRSVDDVLDASGGSPLNKAKKLISPNRMRSFTELFRQDRPISAPSSQTKAGGEGVKAVTFGVPLSELCSQSPGGIPNVVAKVTQFVEDCCLDMEGVYRLSPNARIIETFRATFDKTGDADLTDADPASVSCLLKLFLRELPEPLIPMEALQQVVQKGDTDYPPPSSYLEFLRDVFSEIPPPNYALLKYLIRHLHIVSRHHVENKMNSANLAIVFGPNLFSFGGSLEFLQLQNSSMPALRTMIEYYKDVFSDQPLGRGGAGPAVPKPYKQYRADAAVYEEVTFPPSSGNRTAAATGSGEYELVQPRTTGSGVCEAVAPDDLHVMQNGVMYAVVNKNRKPTSTDVKRDTSTSPDGKPVSPDGKPTSPDGRKDTSTSTEGRVSSSRPSGNDGYEEIDIDFALAKKKGSHLVADSAGLSPRRDGAEPEMPRTPSPLPPNSTPSPCNSPNLTPRRAKALDEAISETVQDLLFDPLQTGQPLEVDLQVGVSTRRDTSTSVAGQPDLSAARQTRQHKKSSKGGVEFQSQSLTDNSVARRRLATSDRKLRNRSSGACFGTSLDVLEQQGDSPEERCEGDSPEQTIRQRLKMFENKPVMGSLPGIGGEVGGASPEGGVEQTDGNSFVFEGVALSRSAPLQHLTKTRVKGPRGRQPPGANKPVSASSEGRGAETTRQTAIPPEVLKPDISKPEPFADNSAVQDRQGVGTDEQRGMVTKEQRGVVTKEQRGVDTEEQRGVVTVEQRGVDTEEQRGVGTKEQRGVDTEEQKGVVTVEQRGVDTEEQRGMVTVEQRGVDTEEQRGVGTKEQRGVVPEEQGGVVAVEQRGVASGKVSWGLSADVAKGAKVFPVEVMERIQSTLREKRRKCGRPDELHEMSWEQLLDEKKSVQTAILQFEKQHGRPDTKAGKDIMKPIYHRYRDIKKRISEGRVAHEAARKSSPSPEHSTLEATLPNVTLSHSLPPQLWREGGSKVASEVVAQRGLATPTGWGPNPTSTSGASTTTHGQSSVLATPPSTPHCPTSTSTTVLEDQRAQWEEKKNALRKSLRTFEKDFETKHGRAPVKADRPDLIDSQYREYKNVKARLRSMELEGVTELQLHQTV